jgi:hypothetical protein
LKRKQQLSSKRCKVLDDEDKKRAENIETTGIRRAMKGVPEKVL